MKLTQKIALATVTALSSVFIATLQPSTANADTTIQVGNDVYATLNDTGNLTISGTGDMWSNETADYFDEIADEIYTVTIESGVTSIGDYAFTDRKYNWSGNVTHDPLLYLQSVTISNTVTSIGDYAFESSNIHEIDIPSSVVTIGKYAFAYSYLEKCTFHKGLYTIDEYAFYDSTLKSVNLPNGISSINEYAFSNISGANVTIPEDIAIIKSNAFYNSTITATIKSNDVLIGLNAFSGYSTTIIANRNSTAETYCKYNSDVTLKYIQYKSTLTFNPNGGSVSTKKKTVLSETYYGKLPSPTRKNYIFDGWYTKKSGGTKITPDTLITTTKNSTLYAHWTKISLTQASKPALTNKSGNRLSVKVNKVKKAEGYQIQYSTKSNMKGSTTIKSTSRSYTLTGMKPKKTYYVRVRAFCKDSTGAYKYGKWSTVSSAKIKK